MSDSARQPADSDPASRPSTEAESGRAQHPTAATASTRQTMPRWRRLIPLPRRRSDPQRTVQSLTSETATGGVENSPQSPQHEPSPHQAMTLMAARGTLMAGIAATAGLIFTGVTTIYTAESTRAQTRQQEKQEEADARAQASSLNLLYSMADKDQNEIEVSNSSNQAIYKVEIAFTFGVFKKFAIEPEGTYVVDAIIGDLGPCQKKTVDPALAAKRYLRISEDEEVRTINQDGIVAQFYDADGAMWWRETGTFREGDNVIPNLAPAKKKGERPGSGSIEPHMAREMAAWEADARLATKENPNMIFADAEEETGITAECGSTSKSS